MHRLALEGSLLCWLLLLSIDVWALPDDRQQPIRLEADSGELDQKTGISVYRGNVVISQGSMRMEAATATIYFKDGRFERMEAVGKPVQLRYKPSVDKPEIQGYGQRVEYNASTARVVMTINAKVIQGKDSFTGDRIEYDLTKDQVKANSDKGKRIEFIIQPETAKVGGP
ncbi:MAG: lipopolysaccharide transport periplasmic protein LptA [Gammaproteobacteria bacterium]|nr:lipopolysaccharide transport periplasmic protein LptA [Gammaproteobacteria bacterium]